MVQGRVDGSPPVPRVFDMLQYFEKILPSVESLWSSLKDEVYFMGGRAAGGLWRHQTWLPSWPPSCILPRTRSKVKTASNGNFLCLTCKITRKYFASFYPQALLLSLKEVEKTCSFTWPPATYDVISRNHRNWSSINLYQNGVRNKRTATENVRC